MGIAEQGDTEREGPRVEVVLVESSEGDRGVSNVKLEVNIAATGW